MVKIETHSDAPIFSFLPLPGIDVENGTAFWAPTINLWKRGFTTGVSSLQLNTVERTQVQKVKGTRPKHNETPSEKTQSQKKRDRQIKKQTRHADMFKKGVLKSRGASSSGYYSHPFWFVWFSRHSALKLGFSEKALFLTFLSTYASLFFTLSFFNPSPGWLMDE